MTEPHFTHWNYRVIADKIGYLSIHEVYYDKKKIIGWVQNEACALGYDLDELKNDLKGMMEALKKPILVEKDGELIIHKDIL